VKYDPIKKALGHVFNLHPYMRVLFYKMLDVLLLRAWYIKRELKKIQKVIGNEAQVLDAGSGFGQYVYYMSTLSKRWNIRGAEIKDEQIADCNQFFTRLKLNNRITFFKADLTTFSEPEQFNLILCVDVMEHIEEDVAVFKNFYNSLQLGGVLLISTPSDKGGSDVHDNDDASFIEEHVREGYNAFDIKEKLKYAGFTRIDIKYSYGVTGSLAWKLSMKYPIIMLNTSKVFFVFLPFYYLLVMPVCLILNYLDVTRFNPEGTGLVIKAWKC